MTQVPHITFCSTCKAGRTFTLLGFDGDDYQYPVIGCCVCGQRLEQLSSDDRDTIGELSTAVNRIDGAHRMDRLDMYHQIGELRDELHELANTVRRNQDNRLLRSIERSVPDDTTKE